MLTCVVNILTQDICSEKKNACLQMNVKVGKLNLCDSVNHFSNQSMSCLPALIRLEESPVGEKGKTDQ